MATEKHTPVTTIFGMQFLFAPLHEIREFSRKLQTQPLVPTRTNQLLKIDFPE